MYGTVFDVYFVACVKSLACLALFITILFSLIKIEIYFLNLWSGEGYYMSYIMILYEDVRNRIVGYDCFGIDDGGVMMRRDKLEWLREHFKIWSIVFGKKIWWFVMEETYLAYRFEWEKSNLNRI